MIDPSTLSPEEQAYLADAEKFREYIETHDIPIELLNHIESQANYCSFVVANLNAIIDDLR